MSKVSIIVPIYNNEKYLEQCLESIINQTLEDIEIILIDDGSTDSSPAICDSFAHKDKRIKVIHKENAGMGVSYNLGINSALGEYIGFVESDDFIEECMFEDLYDLAKKYEVDIVKSGWFEYTNEVVCKNNSLSYFNSYNVISPKSYPWILGIQCTVWSAIYKTNHLKDNNIYYLETPGASYQDVGFTYKALTQTDKIIMSPNAYYYYRMDNENASVKSKEKANVIFTEYSEVDKFLDEHIEIKQWANTNKLIKQYWDYNWNYNRISDELKPNFIKNFALDFIKYAENNELQVGFWENIDADKMELILNSRRP